MRSTLVVLGLLALATPLAGQGSFRFWYAPAPGRALISLAEMRTVTTMQGLPRVPDGTAIEVEARVFSHEEVLGATGEGFRVEVGTDSARVRQREGAAPWTDLPRPGFVGSSAVVEVSPSLQVVGFETSAPEDGIVVRALTGWAANLGFAFPDTTVQVGGTFRTGAQLPFEVTLPPAAGLPLRQMLLGDLQFTLDSVVGRGADTLAYLRFVGRFAPRTVEETGEEGTRTDTFEGGFAGSLLWSTGWDAFVSGATRVRVTGRLARESAAGALEATIEWDATLVHRIRS